jgi:hypothetical protein
MLTVVKTVSVACFSDCAGTFCLAVCANAAVEVIARANRRAGLKREALVTIISADMQRYANFACDDARHVSSMPMTRHVRR